MTRAVVLQGDARHLPLPDASVDLIVTSPPFWQLRSYTDDGQHYEGQIGSEPTPQEYIANLLDCTREWVRVLKPCGSLFVELGDKYAGGSTPGPPSPSSTLRGNGHRGGGPKIHSMPAFTKPRGQSGFPPKCLLDLPSRYSIACVDQLGLIKRANIVWHHVNGLPESVTDRVRAAHSMVFHFTRQPRYYAAVDEIREPQDPANIAHHAKYRGRYGRADEAQPRDHGHDTNFAMNPLGKLPGSVWPIPSAPLTVPARLGIDHFAAFPPALVRPVVLGWSPPGICTACGEGRRPVVDADYVPTQRTNNPGAIERNGDNHFTQGSRPHGRARALASVTGYACACPTPDAPTRPAAVLDPFGGTGTTALVASVHGRTGITVDRSADYCRLAAWRVNDPGERARALGVPKPPPVPDGQDALFGFGEVPA